MHKPPLLLRPPRFGPSADRRWSKSLGRSRTVVQHFGHCPKTSKADRDWEWLRQGVFLLLLGHFVLQLSRVLLTVSRLPIHINHLGRKRSGCTMTGNFSPFDMQLAELSRKVRGRSIVQRTVGQIPRLSGHISVKSLLRLVRSPIYKGDRNLQYTSLFTPVTAAEKLKVQFRLVQSTSLRSVHLLQPLGREERQQARISRMGTQNRTWNICHCSGLERTLSKVSGIDPSADRSG